MVSHQPGKFGDHSCCGSEDMTYLVVEGQDSTRSLSEIRYYSLSLSKAHAMKAHDKLNRCLSHSSWVTSYETS